MTKKIDSSKKIAEDNLLTKSNPPEQKQPFFWKKWLSIAAIVLVILILFAPTIISKTPLLSYLINTNAPINGKIEIGTASLGWFSNTRLSELVVKDADEQTVVSIGNVSLDKSLTGLIFGGIDGTTIRITDPLIDIRVNDGTINLQKLVEESDDDAPAEIPTIRCIVENGRISFFRDSDSFGHWNELNLEIACKPPSSNDEQFLIETTASATVYSSHKNAGNLNADVKLELIGDQPLTASGNMAAKNVSLDFLNAFAELSGAAQISANLSGNLNVDTTFEDDTISKMLAKLDNLEIDSEAADGRTLIANVPSFPLSADGDVNLTADSANVQLTLDTDYGTVKTDGQIPVSGFTSFTDIFEQTFQVNADFDIAKFAADFPELIQLQEGVKLESGKVALTSFARAEGNAKRFFLDIRAGELRAMNGSKAIEWTKPFSLAVALRQNQTQTPRHDVELEYVKMESEFLTIDGSGKLDLGQGSIRGNLRTLKEKLSQFVELGEFDLDGQINGDVNWGVAEPGISDSENEQTVHLSGNINLDNLAYAAVGLPQLNEPNSSVEFTSQYRLEDFAPSELTQLALKASVGTDYLKISLRNPTPFSGDYRFIFDSELQGNTAAWMKRAGSFADLSTIAIEGTTNATAAVFLTPKSIRVRTTKTPTIKPFNLRIADFTIQEPIVRGRVEFTYDFETGLIEAPLISISSSSVNAESHNFGSSQIEDDILYSGDFVVTGNLKRIARWIPQSTVKIDGDLYGTTQIEINQKRNRIVVDGSIANLLVANKPIQTNQFDGQAQLPETIFEDQKVKFDLWVNTTPAGDRINVEKLTAVATGTELSTKGSIKIEGAATTLDLSGKIKTDLAKISEKLKPIFGDNIQFTGSDESTFALAGPIAELSSDPSNQSRQITGPLIPAKLKGNAKLNWNEGKIFALPISKGALDTTLKNSVVSVQPIDMLVGGGQFKLAPTLYLDEQPYRLRVPKGVVLNNAAIGPEVCRTWMRYVAPLLADATTAEGKFTLSLNQDLIMPIENPLAGTFAGQMGIDAITVGPGPLGQSLISMTRQALALIGKEDKLRSLSNKPWLQLPRQAINVTLKDGFIRHDRLVMNIGEVQILTTGSVGLDQSIDMQVVIPIPSDWLSDQPIVKTVLGDAVRIPLRGKLNRPEMSSSFFSQLSKDIAKSAAGNLLENGAKGILEGNLLKGDAKELLEGKAGDLIKEGILKGLRRFRNKK